MATVMARFELRDVSQFDGLVQQTSGPVDEDTMSNEMATNAAVERLTERGRTVTGVHSLTFTEGGELGAALKSITGGKLTVSRTDVVVANGPHGTEVVTQPFAGNTPLPGELHVQVPGALADAAAYDDSGFVGFNWNCSNSELKKYLRSGKFGAHELPEELKHGLTAIKLGWTVQVNAIAADRSWIACQLGGMSGMGAHRSAIDAVDQLAMAVAQSYAAGPQPIKHPLRFGSIAEMAFSGRLESFLAGEDTGPAEQPTRDPGTVRTSIIAALTPHESKRVHVGSIDDTKIRANIAKKIATDVPSSDICGFIDTGMRASGKAGAVFTPTTVYINDIGDRYQFDYVDIRSFRLDGSEVSIAGADGTTVKIASHGEAPIIAEALAAATGRVG